MENLFNLKHFKLNNIIYCLFLQSRNCQVFSSSSQLDPVFLEKRKKFWEQETKWESMVDYSKLTDVEIKIHQCHKEAVQNGHFTYDDPVTHERELTRLRHFLKGACCGSACRHCIYDHEKVPDIKKKGRRYNTAFWVYEEQESKDTELDELAMFNLRKPKPRPS